MELDGEGRLEVCRGSLSAIRPIEDLDSGKLAFGAIICEDLSKFDESDKDDIIGSENRNDLYGRGGVFYLQD